MSREELAWLASALRQPGYKLPGHDENGDPVSGASIRLCLDLGLIEPWLPLPGESLPKVCRLTEKGELLAESFLLGEERSLGEVREIAEELEQEQFLEDEEEELEYESLGLEDILDEEEEAPGKENWWEILPEDLTEEDERLLEQETPRRESKKQRPRVTLHRSGVGEEEPEQALRRRFTPEERQEALRILREGAQGGSPHSPGRWAITTAKFAGGVSLMAVGFLLGWSIDPPFTRFSEPDRVRIAIDQGAPVVEVPLPQSEANAPSVGEVLSIAPSAGPETPAPEGGLHPPSFAAPLEGAPAGPLEPERSPSEKLPPLFDPDLQEKWDRVEATPETQPEAGSEGPAETQLASVPSPLVIERIPLMGETEGAEGEAAGYSVQMAAFNTQEQALAVSASLKNNHRDLLAGLPLKVEEDEVAVLGLVYRIKSGPLPDQGSAERLCASLRQRGQDCFVVTLPASQ